MQELLTGLSLEELTRLYEALPEPVVRALDPHVALALRSRPATVAKRPLAMRVKGLRATLVKRKDEALAGDILRSYFLGVRKDMVTTFLEGVGVAHEDGQVEEDEARPDEEKVAGTVAAMLEEHDPGDVKLYLQVAVLQWPESQALGEALEGLSDDPADVA